MTFVKSIVFGALVSLGLASANPQTYGGITYNNPVSAITYSNLGCTGTYQAVTGYNKDDCSCTYSPKTYSGPLAPLNEGLSLHLRGPLQLKQFGVYYPKTNAKRDIHQHLGHRYHSHHKKKDCGTWEQSAYYNADQQVANGLTFLNHHGGAGSGSFDLCGGLSLSYMSPDTKTGSPTPNILYNNPINSGDEFAIFSDQPCTDATCGFCRPGIPAFQGFAGDTKIFVFEFKMPRDGNTGFNGDMPAIWALNSNVPRSFQYGIKKGSCSCWETGCGELDLFEILTDNKGSLISHYHSTQGTGNQYGGGGSPDYFERPVDKFMKAAVIFDGAKKDVIIRFLPDDCVFGKEMVDEDFMDLQGVQASEFPLPS